MYTHHIKSPIVPLHRKVQNLNKNKKNPSDHIMPIWQIANRWETNLIKLIDWFKCRHPRVFRKCWFHELFRICIISVTWFFFSISLSCTFSVWWNCTVSICECLADCMSHTFPIVSCGDNSSLGLAPELLQKVIYKNTWILSSKFGKYISLLTRTN